MFEITTKGRAFIHHHERPRASCASWVRADAVANYERFRERFAIPQFVVSRQPLPPA